MKKTTDRPENSGTSLITDTPVKTNNRKSRVGKYLSFFKIRFSAGLQYRAAADCRSRDAVLLGTNGNTDVYGILSQRPLGDTDGMGFARVIHLASTGTARYVHALVLRQQHL